MRWSASTLCALLALGSSVLQAGAQAPTTVADRWSEQERRTLRSLWIGSLGQPPHDPSNRYAGDAGAARLGQRLFFETRLSRTGTFSCASCHRPELYFTDGLPRSRALGTTLRGAPTLIGSSHSPWFYWDGRRDSQWSQALAPMEAAEELGSTRVGLVRLMASDETYRRDYEEVFGPLPGFDGKTGRTPQAGPLGTREERQAWDAMSDDERGAINGAFANMGKALAAYQRMLAPGASRFDRHVEAVLSNSESKSGLSKDEIAGLRLFISADAQCLRCHNGPLFTNHGFHNVGSSAVTDPRPDPGRAAGIPQVLEHEFNCFSPYSDAREPQCLELRFIKKEGEELPGAFKVPTLRNVAETAPYMHDGELGTLEDVLRHYSEPSYGIGHLELSPMNFTSEEIRQLGAFLKTLTSQLEDRQWLTPPKEERTSGSPRDP